MKDENKLYSSLVARMKDLIASEQITEDYALNLMNDFLDSIADGTKFEEALKTINLHLDMSVNNFLAQIK